MSTDLFHTFGQTYYTYTTTTASTGPSGLFWAIYFTVIAIVAITALISMWRIFTKAGEKGWKAIIPIYNAVILLRIVKRPVWWICLYLIPIVSLVVAIVVYIDLAKAFGRGVGLALVMIFLPFIGLPVLAFGDNHYHLAAAPEPVVHTPMTTPPTPPSPIA